MLPKKTQKHLKQNIEVYSKNEFPIISLCKTIIENKDEKYLIQAVEIIENFKDLFNDKIEFLEYYRLRQNKEIHRLQNLKTIIEDIEMP